MSRNLMDAGMFTGTHEVYVEQSVLQAPEAFKRSPVFAAQRSLICFFDVDSQCVYFVPDEQASQDAGLLSSLNGGGGACCRVNPDSQGRLPLPRQLLRRTFGSDDFPARVRGVVSYFSLHADRCADDQDEGLLEATGAAAG